MAQPQIGTRSTRSRAQLQRDAALARISHARRWMIVGAAGLTGLISAVVSAIAPGHSLASRSHAQSRTTARPAPRTSSLRMPPLKSGSQLGLQAPSQAPQPSPAPQSSPAPQPAPAPQAAPQPQSAPASSSGGGGAVSGGS